MPTRPYVALLRGINVGGRNKVAMGDLRAAFEVEGYRDVATYIQSGNVLFSADVAGAQLETTVERMLQRHLGIAPVVVVRSDDKLREVVRRAPDGFGEASEAYHCDVVFLKAPLTGDAVMDVVELREGVDEAWPGDGAVYFRRLRSARSQSRLSRLVGKPEYQRMTIRNWRTTTRLLTLLDGHDRRRGGRDG